MATGSPLESVCPGKKDGRQQERGKKMGVDILHLSANSQEYT